MAGVCSEKSLGWLVACIWRGREQKASLEPDPGGLRRLS